MSDQGSTYAVLQSVPVMVSPLYKLPKKILIASELKMVPDDVTKLPTYPFAVEREVIAQVEAARKETFEAEEAFKLQKQKYEEEKINKQKVAARKIAPGFLDTDTRILQPQQTYIQEQPSGNSEESPKTEHSNTASPKILQPSTTQDTKTTTAENGAEKQIDYLKFEQGLAPADPWDTPENDMVALRSILGSPKSGYPQRRTSTPPSYPPQQYQQPPPSTQHPRPYQKNEGVYWSFQNSANNAGNYSPHPRQLQPISVPAIPPKLFNNGPLPTSSTSSPIISPPSLPPLSDYHKAASISGSSPTPPPLPPLPTAQPALPHENLINELGNMGFTRAQAIDALEKNDHDLIKATNFLLDQA